MTGKKIKFVLFLSLASFSSLFFFLFVVWTAISNISPSLWVDLFNPLHGVSSHLHAPYSSVSTSKGSTAAERNVTAFHLRSLSQSTVRHNKALQVWNKLTVWMGLKGLSFLTGTFSNFTPFCRWKVSWHILIFNSGLGTCSPVSFLIEIGHYVCAFIQTVFSLYRAVHALFTCAWYLFFIIFSTRPTIFNFPTFLPSTLGWNTPLVQCHIQLKLEVSIHCMKDV